MLWLHLLGVHLQRIHTHSHNPALEGPRGVAVERKILFFILDPFLSPSFVQFMVASDRQMLKQMLYRDVFLWMDLFL